MNVIKRAYHFFLILGIFFIPFNSSIPNWLGFLGEYSSDSSPIFFLISFGFLFLYSVVKGNLYIPLKSNEYSVFLLFIVLICVVTLLNLFDILHYFFKQTSGIQRFMRQFISILISSVVFFLVFVNTGRDYGYVSFFKLIRKIFLVSFIIVFSCGILEYLIISHKASFLIPIIKIFNVLPFVEVHLIYHLQRVSSITYEPPALGMYLITISGFMFSYILSSKSKTRFIPFILVVILALISKSRTAFVVIIFQVMVGLFYAYMAYPRFKVFFNKLLLVTSIGVFFIFILFWKPIFKTVQERMDQLDISQVKYSEDNHSVSNKSRLGIQVAMFEVFKQKPILGTGWGQQTFESRHHYPDWALKNNYEFYTLYQNEKIKQFPPGYNMYLRVLTETGVIGFIVFGLFLFLVLTGTYYTYVFSVDKRYISIALFISFSGYMLNWLQIDSFRIYGFWLCLALLILFKKHIRNQSLNLNKINNLL